MSITVDGASAASSTAPRNARSRIVSATTGVIDAAEHPSQLEPTAVAVARAHVDAWGEHDCDVARAALASDVHVVVTSVDPDAPRVDTIGIEEYMDGLVQFGQAVVPGSTRVSSAIGDESRALLQVTDDAAVFDPRVTADGHFGARACAPGGSPNPSSARGAAASGRRPVQSDTAALPAAHRSTKPRRSARPAAPDADGTGTVAAPDRMRSAFQLDPPAGSRQPKRAVPPLKATRHEVPASGNLGRLGHKLFSVRQRL